MLTGRPCAALQVAFGSVGSLPTAVLKRVRADYEGIVAHELAEHRRRLEAVLSQPARSKQRAGNAGEGTAAACLTTTAHSSRGIAGPCCSPCSSRMHVLCMHLLRRSSLHAGGLGLCLWHLWYWALKNVSLIQQSRW